MSSETTSATPFKPDYRIAKLSLIGIAGFIIGCVFLFYDDLFSSRNTESVFHEISFQPREYAAAFINKAVDSLSVLIETNKKELNAYPQEDTPRLVKEKKDLLKAKITLDTGYIVKLSAHKKLYEDLATVDTTSFNELNKYLHFQITPDSIAEWDCRFANKEFTRKKREKNDTAVEDCVINTTETIPLLSVNCYFKDPAFPFKMGGKIEIAATRSPSDIDFITKYPGAAVWLILVFIFCSFCFMAIATSTHLKNKVAGIFSETDKVVISGKYYISNYYIICINTALVIGGMAFLWNRTFYDTDIVRNLFFMKHLDVSMTWVIMLGSVAGAFCLAGFVYTASMVSHFVKPVNESIKKMELLKSGLAKFQAVAPEAAEAKKEMADSQASLDAEAANFSVEEEKFTKLSNIFRSYFFLTAIILSLMVLCTGALFSTINSLDFVRLIANDWGYSPVRSDYVYLYGALYTVILLLVYIPAKMRFAEVNADVWGNKPTGEEWKWTDFFKDPFGKMKGLLVATSPLLVSLIQTVLDMLFK